VTDFRKLAVDANERLQAEALAREAEERAKREKSENDVARAKAAITDHIMPILNKAKADFALEGIHSDIQLSDNVVGHYRHSDGKSLKQIWPSVKFQCKSPPREGDNWQSSAIPIFLECDGDEIFASAGQHEGSRLGDVKLSQGHLDQADTIVSKAVERALESYFAMMKSLPNIRKV